MYRIGVVANNSVVMILWDKTSGIGCRVYIKSFDDCLISNFCVYIGRTKGLREGPLQAISYTGGFSGCDTPV